MALAAFIFHLNLYLTNRLIFMLAYWYNVPRHIKLIFIIVVCAAIYAANQVQPLSPTYTVLSLVLGSGLHFGQYLQTKIPEHSSHKLKLQFLLRIYPLIIVAIIMWLLPPQHNWIATIQALGFVLVDFFLFRFIKIGPNVLNSKCSSLSYLSISMLLSSTVY